MCIMSFIDSDNDDGRCLSCKHHAAVLTHLVLVQMAMDCLGTLATSILSKYLAACFVMTGQAGVDLSPGVGGCA